MNEKDVASLLKPSQEPSTQTPAPGMTRVRFFRIWPKDPESYDAILEAYRQAPLMPVVQIPRVAVEYGEKVEVIDVDVPLRDFKQIQEEPILRGDGIRILRRPTEAVIVFPYSPAQPQVSQTPTDNMNSSNPWVRTTMSNEELEKAKQPT